jgi:hypothetical protein
MFGFAIPLPSSSSFTDMNRFTGLPFSDRFRALLHQRAGLPVTKYKVNTDPK